MISKLTTRAGDTFEAHIPSVRFQSMGDVTLVIGGDAEYPLTTPEAEALIELLQRAI